VFTGVQNDTRVHDGAFHTTFEFGNIKLFVPNFQQLYIAEQCKTFNCIGEVLAKSHGRY